MFDTQAFKKSVLNQALQGKLTQQLPEDGNAIDLLKFVVEEKQQLVKTGKIKKLKQLTAVTNDEIPFNIPDNWQWVKLNNLSFIISGRDIPKKYHSDKQSQNTIPYITGAGNFGNFHLKTNTYLNKKYANVISQKDDLLITVKGTIGKLAFLPYDKAHIARQIIAIRCFNGIKSSFIEKLLELVKNDLSSKSKSIIPGIKQNNLKNLLVPLPPLAEQNRIVNNINQCFKLADLIDQEQKLTKDFDDDMYKSLLQSAMQGKLTQQLPEDGNAADLLHSIAEEKQRLYKAGKIKKPKQLAAITDDEIPFKIPDNWQWVRIGDLVLYDIGGNTPSKANTNNWNEHGIPWLSVKDINNGYINDSIDHISIEASKSTARMIPSNSFVAVTRMAVGKFTINTKPMAINQDLRALIMDNNIMNYIRLIYPALQFKTKGATVKGITKKTLLNTIIPLPPLKEQKHIINKLKLLLSKIDRI